ncbi:MAG TPA: hypothetical protein VGM92_07360 [Candidatus Kapabacteria bacterium]|jgi:hypothetical protein
MKRSLFFLFAVVPILFTRCDSGPDTHWVPTTELQPADQPNIREIELKDGSQVIFNRELGWYDRGRAIVEGVTLTGWHPAVPLDSIRSIEIQDRPQVNRGLETFLIVIGGLFALGLIAGIIFTIELARSGCIMVVAILFIGGMSLLFCLV